MTEAVNKFIRVLAVYKAQNPQPSFPVSLALADVAAGNGAVREEIEHAIMRTLLK